MTVDHPENVSAQEHSRTGANAIKSHWEGYTLPKYHKEFVTGEEKVISQATDQGPF